MAAAGALRFTAPLAARSADGQLVLTGTLRVDAPVVMSPSVGVRIEGAGGAAAQVQSNEARAIGWLPRGDYRVEVLPPSDLPAGPARWRMDGGCMQSMRYEVVAGAEGRFEAPQPSAGAPTPLVVRIESISPTPPLEALSWSKGHADWFFRHFDHAGPTVISYMLGDSPLLRGRILDVGCGDGITDLSIALRTGCTELVGVDPFRGYENLAQIAARNHLPADAIPPNLRFMPESANALPFADDSFDVVISWGSVEHIAGGYEKALREIRRVLRAGGLFFVHPGLYYASFGHHLGEFSPEPHFHLKKTLEEVKRIVFETPINRMDRSGHEATPQEYWQWFRELNPITVTRFEQELRALDFQPWRVALRTEGLVEYTAEIEHYPMQDLATAEAYISCVNRKKPG